MPQENQPQEGSQPNKLADVLIKKSGGLNVHETVREAGDKLRSLDADSLPVFEDSKLVGRVAERHPDRSAAGRGHDPQVERVGACMSREIIFCYEDQDRGEAERLMIERGLKYLPIVDRDMKIIGIVTLEDLAAVARAAEASEHSGSPGSPGSPGPSE